MSAARPAPPQDLAQLRGDCGAAARRTTGRRPVSAPAILERTTFRTNRLLDFASEKELVSQSGHQKDTWPVVILKELVDNAIDASEEAGAPPVVTVTVDRTGTSLTIPIAGGCARAEAMLRPHGRVEFLPDVERGIFHGWQNVIEIHFQELRRHISDFVIAHWDNQGIKAPRRGEATWGATAASLASTTAIHRNPPQQDSREAAVNEWAGRWSGPEEEPGF
jgi:hypothetical protein